MGYSKLIAGLAGPLMMAMGVAMLINRAMFPEMIAQLSQSYALIFLAGILSLLAGITVVRVHNIWSGGWEVIITILGWLLILGGLVRMWFPNKAAAIAANFGTDTTYLLLAGVIVLALGAFLSFKAYGSNA